MRGRRVVRWLVLMMALAESLWVGVAQPLPPRHETWVIHDLYSPPAGFNALMVPGVAYWGTYLMYPTLFLGNVYYGPKLEEVILPYLASGFRWVDSLTLEVTLRPEARWWDGVPITAHDVKFSWELGKRHPTYWNTAFWDFLEEVRVIDDKVVQFVTTPPKAVYFELLRMLTSALVLPRHRWEPLEAKYGAKLTVDFKDDDPAQIVGGGPYKLERWDLDYALYVRVDNWWGKDIFGLPRPKYLLHRTFKTAAARNLAFERGEVDAICSVIEVWELQARGLPIRSYYDEAPYFLPSFGWGLFINFARPPLNDPVLRRAIAYALPAEEIGRSLPAPHAPAHPTMIIDVYAWAKALIDEKVVADYGWRYDPEKAKRLLDAAGIVDRDGDGVREMPDGTRLGPWTVTCWTGFADGMLAADLIAHHLRKIGIDVVAEFYDFVVWDGKVIRGEFDMTFRWIFGITFGYPWNVFRSFLDPRVTGPVGTPYPVGNWHRYMNWAIVPILDAIPKEPDPAKVKAYYSLLQLYQLRDVVVVPLFYGVIGHVFSEQYWVGWPTSTRPDGWMYSIVTGTWPGALPQLFGLVPAGEDFMTSPYDTHMKRWIVPVSAFWDALAKAPKAG